MKTNTFLFLVITILVGCGEDTNGPRRGEIFIPTITRDNFVVPSHIHKSREQLVLESRAVSNLIRTGTLPDGYRIAPVMATDDEGASTTDVRTRTSLGRPDTNCGNGSGLSAADRIRNCSTANGNKATWNGTFGGAGEATWNLVAKSAENEVWMDSRTGLIWSHVVAVDNWCNAAGNNRKETVPLIDCSQLGTDFSCVGRQFIGLTGITWRLPTRNDYLQADLDGLRYVLTDSADVGHWTATIDSASAGRSKAWVYIQEQGTIESVLLTENRNVRCVGAASF